MYRFQPMMFKMPWARTKKLWEILSSFGNVCETEASDKIVITGLEKYVPSISSSLQLELFKTIPQEHIYVLNNSSHLKPIPFGWRLLGLRCGLPLMQ